MWFIVVCNAGQYRAGSDCELCTGNTIKSMIGEATDCKTYAACDGKTKVLIQYTLFVVRMFNISNDC